MDVENDTYPNVYEQWMTYFDEYGIAITSTNTRVPNK